MQSKMSYILCLVFIVSLSITQTVHGQDIAALPTYSFEYACSGGIDGVAIVAQGKKAMNQCQIGSGTVYRFGSCTQADSAVGVPVKSHQIVLNFSIKEVQGNANHVVLCNNSLNLVNILGGGGVSSALSGSLQSAVCEEGIFIALNKEVTQTADKWGDAYRRSSQFVSCRFKISRGLQEPSAG